MIFGQNCEIWYYKNVFDLRSDREIQISLKAHTPMSMMVLMMLIVENIKGFQSTWIQVKEVEWIQEAAPPEMRIWMFSGFLQKWEVWQIIILGSPTDGGLNSNSSLSSNFFVNFFSDLNLLGLLWLGEGGGKEGEPLCRLWPLSKESRWYYGERIVLRIEEDMV